MEVLRARHFSQLMKFFRVECVQEVVRQFLQLERFQTSAHRCPQQETMPRQVLQANRFLLRASAFLEVDIRLMCR